MYGEILLFLLVYYYILPNYRLFFKKNRKFLTERNDTLNKYRKKKFKTLEEQKEFVDYVRPKSNFKWSWTIIIHLVIGFGKFILAYTIYWKILSYLAVSITIWTALAFWVLIPFVMSYVLTKFNLETDNLFHILKWR